MSTQVLESFSVQEQKRAMLNAFCLSSSAAASDITDMFPRGFKKAMVFMVVFYLLVGAMTSREQTALEYSKNIQIIASIQKQENKAIGQINFSICSRTANTARQQQVNQDNMEYSALRENIQDDLITARQGGEVLMTQASTEVNLLQQDASEDTGWLKTMNTIFEVVDEITQNL